MNWRNCFGFPEQSAIRFGKVNDREKNRMSEEKLKRSFGTKDVFTLVFGTMIGWGWIMLSGQWATSAGMMGAIIAYVVGAVLCVFVGLVYSELTPTIPYTEGSVVFSYKATH